MQGCMYRINTPYAGITRIRLLGVISAFVKRHKSTPGYCGCKTMEFYRISKNHFLNFQLYLLKIMKSRYFLLMLSFAFALALTSLYACKKESETLGCVTGLTQYKGNRLPIGCMTRAEFDEYLKEPFFRDPSSNLLIDKELMFKKVTDCSECN